MADPCIVIYRNKEYAVNEWIEYLAKEGLDEMIKNGEIVGMKGLGGIPLKPGGEYVIKSKGDVYDALVRFGYNEQEARDNADLMDAAADAAYKRYGVEKEDYYNLVLRDFTPREGDRVEGLKQMEMPDGRTVSVRKLPEGVSVVDGWYSPIEKNLRETKIDRQSANKWLTSGLIGKGDEAIYTGVKQWLESKNPQEQVSKQEILDWMKDNRVEVVEVVKGLGVKEIIDSDELPGYIQDAIVDYENGDITKDEFENVFEGTGYDVNFGRDGAVKSFTSTKESDTKFSQYQLEGEKENYKELLVTLPSMPKFEIVKWKDGGYVLKVNGNNYAFNESINHLKQVQTEIESGKRKGDVALFKSTHFDEPNILVHLRMNTRTDADGNKVLLLEEVQSDFAQSYKKDTDAIKDYVDKNKEKVIEAFKKKGILEVICP